MSERIIKLMICDRCHFECKLDYVGLTTVDKFEKRPDGWKQRIDIGLLCPECNTKYTRLIERFMREDI